MSGTTTIDAKGYKTSELIAAVDLDAYAIRDECERRSSVLTRKLARLYKDVADAEREQCQLEEAYKAAWAEIHR